MCPVVLLVTLEGRSSDFCLEYDVWSGLDLLTIKVLLTALVVFDQEGGTILGKEAQAAPQTPPVISARSEVSRPGPEAPRSGLGSVSGPTALPMGG